MLTRVKIMWFTDILDKNKIVNLKRKLLELENVKTKSTMMINC